MKTFAIEEIYRNIYGSSFSVDFFMRVRTRFMEEYCTYKKEASRDVAIEMLTEKAFVLTKDGLYSLVRQKNRDWLPGEPFVAFEEMGFEGLTLQQAEIYANVLVFHKVFRDRSDILPYLTDGVALSPDKDFWRNVFISCDELFKRHFG